MWLKPDGLATGTLNTWVYANNGANSFTATAGSQPTVVANGFNFWPAVNFSGAQFMSGPTGANAPIQPLPTPQAYAVFAVWSSTMATGASGTSMRVWAQRQANGTNSDNSFDGASLWVYPQAATVGAPYGSSGPTYGDQPEVPNWVTGINTAPAYTTAILTYAPSTPYISSMNLLAQNTNDLELMDQTNYSAGPGVTSTDPAGAALTNRNISTQANLLGARSASLDEPFTGNLAELIVLNTNVTTTQRQQIFSYLALKYGIPLNGSYLSSTGATIWDPTALSGGYNNFVFGLGQDNGSGLTAMSQSNSMSTSGVSGAANIALSNASSLTDQGFMMVGSNNAGTGEITTNVPTVAAGSSRLQDQWLVQNTGTVGTVDVAVDLTGITTTGTKGTSTDFRLVTDNDGDGDFTTGTQGYYTPTSWTSSNNVANFTAVNLSNSSKVVFTVLTAASGGTPLPVNWVSFTAVPDGANVNLNWTVGANEQAKVYQVQRSTDGATFTNIGDVSNDAAVKSYSYVDAGVGAGSYYYRVLEVDQDGESIYSKVVTVNMNGGGFSIKLLNNPTISSNTEPELRLTTNTSGNVLLEIWTLAGARAGSFQQAIGNGTTTMRIPMTGLAPGTYALKVTLNNTTQTLQVVKL